MRLRNLSKREANGFVAQHHRHNKPVAGLKFALGAMDDAGDLVGVVIGGRPVARHLDDGATCEVLRLCVRDGAPRCAASYLLAAARRAAQALALPRVLTYTLEAEGGASLRGAGWQAIARRRPRPSGWNRASRHRDQLPTDQHAKVLWQAPADG